MDISKLEQSIGYEFKDKQLLQTALTHTSYAYEHHVQSYEKLEFLGDSILEFLSSEYIYENFPNLKEGEMTKVRATVVCEESLAQIAKLHNFSDFLNLGKSEKLSGGNARNPILEDTVEAVIAAIYKDGGIDQARKFIVENLKNPIEYATKHVGVKDYKTVLQEKLQVNGDVKIEYVTIAEKGPDHDKSFEAEVRYEGRPLARGKGKSKKAAEMQAAKKALEENKT
ncbi:MAG: ribonuclease III [Clostridia bacterium]|nr:ribonuclease III [Clostridia bacterium]